MDLSITGRHIEITESMSQFVREKISRLERLYDRIEDVHVVTEHAAQQFRTEIVVHVDHKRTFVAQVEAEKFNESFDLAMSKMERQLHEHKEKFRNRKHQSGE
ncbi:MAG: ribosome-associated translation inhibitor RaiA [Phycisphaerae bacterium]|nr:ribosome-associated translation inhibitor RaiA [Phycisphaerae bacterium]